MAAKSVWLIFIGVSVFLDFATTSVPRSRQLFPLDIIHYNDFHDRFEETSVQSPMCVTNDSKCIGGFARLCQEIKTIQKQKPDALILNAGDAFQGTYWYTLLKWNVTQHFMNLLPHDAHTLGNHEFDNGVEGLAPYLAKLRAPMVVANIDTKDEPSLNGLYQPYIVVKRKGRKIGIIGVITPDTKTNSRTGKVIFSDPIEAVREQAKILTEQGVDIIVVLSHCGIKVDKKMAKEAGENVDIIVGGHTHSLLWNSETAPSFEDITGPYPVIVESKSRKGRVVGTKKVLVVTASSFTKYLGNITAYFDAEGELVSFDGGPIFLDRSIPEDPEIKSLMQPYIDHLHRIVSEVLGSTESDLLDRPCGSGECLLGDVISDAMLNAAKEVEKSNLPMVVFSFRNVIRGGITKGEITRGSLINSLPFGNKIVSFTIKGKYLIEALDRCMTMVWKLKPFTGPWMPQVAGMKVSLNATARKVDQVQIKLGDDLQQLGLDEDYRVVSLDFLADGGNGFTMLKENGRDLQVIGVDFEVFEQYILQNSPVKHQLDNRLVIVT